MAVHLPSPLFPNPSKTGRLVSSALEEFELNLLGLASFG